MVFSEQKNIPLAILIELVLDKQLLLNHYSF